MIFYLLFIFISLGLYIIEIPSYIILSVLLIYFLRFNNKFTNATVFLFSYSVLGVYLNKIGIPYLISISFYSYSVYLFLIQGIFKKTLKYFVVVLLFFFLLFNSSLIAPSIGSSFLKLQSIAINFFLSLTIFYFIFKNMHEIEFQKVAFSIVLLVLFAFSYAIDTLGFPKLLNLEEFFGFFRNTQERFVYENDLDFKLNYQYLGFLLNVSLVFYIFSFDTFLKKLLFFLLTILVIIYSGSRQNLIAHFAIFYLYWIFNAFSYKKLSISIFLLGFILLFISNFNNSSENELLSVFAEKNNILEATGRDQLVLIGISYFLKNPVFGTGLGGFYYAGGYDNYPHNLLVEILSELGIIGLLILLLIFVYFKFDYKLQIIRINGYLGFFLVLLLTLLIPSIVSGDLSQNIRLFALLFLPLLLEKPTVLKSHFINR